MVFLFILKLNNYTKSGADVTPAEALKFVNSKMTKSNQVNKKPHINTMSKKDVNVYEVKTGIYAYASGLAVDTDGSDPDDDPDHQDETKWKDSDGDSIGAHRSSNGTPPVGNKRPSRQHNAKTPDSNSHFFFHLFPFPFIR
ncbi:unnamed protein product [Meloidogyne enterolobii]|uniref:Uncharacterized protein n=1 Tax=Meloidogyne enterolobii TaxID=390850 RepID=A0ACB0XKC7_MELEN